MGHVAVEHERLANEQLQRADTAAPCAKVVGATPDEQSIRTTRACAANYFPMPDRSYCRNRHILGNNHRIFRAVRYPGLYGGSQPGIRRPRAGATDKI